MQPKTLATNWLPADYLKKGGTLNNSPVPASQLPYRKPSVKEVTSGGVPVEKRIQNSKTSPEALLKNKLKSKFEKGGKSPIHIKPENKGKFTATKKETGKTTEELTHSKNPVTKKRAVFAQNASR